MPVAEGVASSEEYVSVTVAPVVQPRKSHSCVGVAIQPLEPLAEAVLGGHVSQTAEVAAATAAENAPSGHTIQAAAIDALIVDE